MKSPFERSEKGVNTLNVFPDKQLIVAKYSGDVCMDDVVRLTEEMVSNPNYSPLFNGVTDYRGAKLSATSDEVTAFAKDVIESEVSLGTWCILCDEPNTTAYNMIFQSLLKSRHPVEIYSTVDAASKRLNMDLKEYLNP